MACAACLAKRAAFVANLKVGNVRTAVRVATSGVKQIVTGKDDGFLNRLPKATPAKNKG